ncbi:PEP/pyruvate-binding domain-containing protein [Myxococcota bacterium]
MSKRSESNMHTDCRPLLLFFTSFVVCLSSCSENNNGSGPKRQWDCVIATGEEPDFVRELGCNGDFSALASIPLDASIPGASSVKTVIDRVDNDALYFQNSKKYPIHWNFANEHLSGEGKPFVPDLGQFNLTEYYSPHRRFLLGAVTWYEGAGAWTYEIAPYDTASADMIAQAYWAIVDSSFFGNELHFHPTSQAVQEESENYSSAVRTMTTDELFEGVDYQPLNLGTSFGRLRFFKAAQLEADYVDFRDVVVLDSVPNDISVVMGIITAEFQTPLSHINVLSQNRGTPNMALRGAEENDLLRALEGKWVRFEVGAFDFSIEEVTKDQADTWWEENKPEAVQVPNLDLSVTELADIGDLLDPDLGLGAALNAAIPAFGGKASHYAAAGQIGAKVPMPKAFAVPVFYYWEFMQEHGFDDWVATLIADADFQNDPMVREQRLSELRDAMEVAPVDPGFATMLESKLASDYGGIRMRFRSSTNAEDLDGFTGAGLYISWTGAVGDPRYPVLDAVRKVWSSVWYFRAFEERSYRSIDHETVGMALLVHKSFADEEANGVALTNNPYDTSGLEPGFYVNVQRGEASVVKPMPGVTSDQFIYHFDFPGQPIVFIAHSNLVPEGCTVLTTRQTYDLGVALKAIHQHFLPIYGRDPTRWYAMDVEFKLDGDTCEEPKLFIKQARPHSGWGG